MITLYGLMEVLESNFEVPLRIIVSNDEQEHEQEYYPDNKDELEESEYDELMDMEVISISLEDEPYVTIELYYDDSECSRDMEY